MSELVVTIPDDHVAERTYIVSVLLADFLGFPYRIEQRRGGAWVIAHDDKHLVIDDALFGRHPDGTGYIAAANIPASVHAVESPWSARPLVGLFGQPSVVTGSDDIYCRSDLFAAAFFMLTRWEERANPTRDQHGRFPASASLAVREGFLHRPIVNEYADWIASALAHLGYRHPRRQRSFSIVLSHDVDHPQLWRWKTAAITLGGDLLRRRDPRLALRTARDVAAVTLGRRKDPYDTFDWIMDLSDRAGVVSQFNFMTGGDTDYDPRHTYDSPAIRRTMRTIAARGHRIGFHPSYLAPSDDARFARELVTLRAMSPVPVIAGRNHFLHFDVPGTWQMWARHGLHVDSSVGFADHEGFRAGCCYPYRVFDVIERRVLPLVEQPLIVMDTTLVGYRHLSPEEAAAALDELRATVAGHDGELTLLWHNSNLDVAPWLPYRTVYEEFIARGGRGKVAS